MKKLIFILTVGGLFAQYLPDVSKMSETEKMLVYENNKKSPALGVVFSLLLPTAGHAYAGKWGKGLMFLGGEVLCGVFSLGYYSKAKDKRYTTCPSYYEEIEGKDGCWNESYDGEIYRVYDVEIPNHEMQRKSFGFLLGYVGLVVWEKIDAGKEVKKYNKKLYKHIFGKEPPSFSLNLQPTYQGANLTMSYSFD